ncbi:unnamed protein product [Sphenostylis stenocarpa]|uniref:Uncharacterized protein n=1 Tax=Sphenostylis stenocarpa TaxID=92480 RepID=A0AA86W0E3_9FABA|nr:unnamed protein product [Sphenostylis stenocarpa]
MKAILIVSLSFLPLLAFLTNATIKNADQVIDVYGNGVFPGISYYILPAVPAPVNPPDNGGLKLAKTGNSNCALTVLHDNSKLGFPVKFILPGISLIEIYIGSPLEIKFKDSPQCAKSPKWMVFVDKELNETFVGIGGAEGHPGQQIFDGTFHVEIYNFWYKLVFCQTNSTTCSDIGMFHPLKGEDGRRLYLTKNKPFNVMFLNATH